MSERPALSVIVLTRNEADNIAGALRSLLLQEGVALEVIVVDSASMDRTLEIAREVEARDPARVRIVASPHDIPIGLARNLGIAHARGQFIAQMSADAMAAPGWAAALVRALEGADIVYGRQEHAPDAWTVASVTRGLRYHTFRDANTKRPERHASNVNCGVRREVLDHVRYVDDGPASALDDILLTREAMELGFRVAYAPDMLVRHKDVTTLAGEARKNKREGYGWGLLSRRLGLHWSAVAWGGALVATAVSAVFWPSVWIAGLGALVLYAPVARRALLAGGRFLRRAPAALAGAVAMGPVFDLVFLYHYALGLRDRRSHVTGLRSRGNAA